MSNSSFALAAATGIDFSARPFVNSVHCDPPPATNNFELNGGIDDFEVFPLRPSRDSGCQNAKCITAKRNYESIMKDMVSIDTIYGQLDKLRKENQQLQRIVTEKSTYVEQVAEQIREKDNENANIQAQFHAMEQQKQEADNLLKAYQDKQQDSEVKISRKYAASSLQQHKQKLQEQEHKYQMLNSKYLEAGVKYKNLVETFDDYSKDSEKIKKELGVVKNKYENLKEKFVTADKAKSHYQKLLEQMHKLTTESVQKMAGSSMSPTKEIADLRRIRASVRHQSESAELDSSLMTSDDDDLDLIERSLARSPPRPTQPLFEKKKTPIKLKRPKKNKQDVQPVAAPSIDARVARKRAIIGAQYSQGFVASKTMQIIEGPAQDRLNKKLKLTDDCQQPLSVSSVADNSLECLCQPLRLPEKCRQFSQMIRDSIGPKPLERVLKRPTKRLAIRPVVAQSQSIDQAMIRKSSRPVRPRAGRKTVQQPIVEENIKQIEDIDQPLVNDEVEKVEEAAPEEEHPEVCISTDHSLTLVVEKVEEPTPEEEHPEVCYSADHSLSLVVVDEVDKVEEPTPEVCDSADHSLSLVVDEVEKVEEPTPEVCDSADHSLSLVVDEVEKVEEPTPEVCDTADHSLSLVVDEVEKVEEPAPEVCDSPDHSLSLVVEKVEEPAPEVCDSADHSLSLVVDEVEKVEEPTPEVCDSADHSLSLVIDEVEKVEEPTPEGEHAEVCDSPDHSLSLVIHEVEKVEEPTPEEEHPEVCDSPDHLLSLVIREVEKVEETTPEGEHAEVCDSPDHSLSLVIHEVEKVEEPTPEEEHPEVCDSPDHSLSLVIDEVIDQAKTFLSPSRLATKAVPVLSPKSSTKKVKTEKISTKTRRFAADGALALGDNNRPIGSRLALPWKRPAAFSVKPKVSERQKENLNKKIEPIFKRAVDGERGPLLPDLISKFESICAVDLACCFAHLIPSLQVDMWRPMMKNYRTFDVPFTSKKEKLLFSFIKDICESEKWPGFVEKFIAESGLIIAKTEESIAVVGTLVRTLALVTQCLDDTRTGHIFEKVITQLLHKPSDMVFRSLVYMCVVRPELFQNAFLSIFSKDILRDLFLMTVQNHFDFWNANSLPVMQKWAPIIVHLVQTESEKSETFSLKNKLSLKLGQFRYCNDSFVISENGRLSLQSECNQKLVDLTLLFDHCGTEKQASVEKEEFVFNLINELSMQLPNWKNEELNDVTEHALLLICLMKVLCLIGRNMNDEKTFQALSSLMEKLLPVIISSHEMRNSDEKAKIIWYSTSLFLRNLPFNSLSNNEFMRNFPE